MTITHTWEIDMIHTKSDLGIDDAVVEVHWSKHGKTEDGIHGRYPGMSKFSINDIDPNNFIPIKNLSKENVLNWIKGTIDEKHMEHIDAQIKGHIDFQINGTTNKTLTYDEFPWKTS